MKLTLAEPKYFKESINIISDLVSEARFNVTKNGIELIAMDPANVAMVIFKLLPSSFLEYDLEKDVEIALNLGNLKQMLRRINPTDVLTIEVVDNKFKMTLKGSSLRNFQLPLLDLDERQQKIPDLSFNAVIDMESSSLNNAIEDCDIVAEAVSFIADQEKFTVLGEGDLSRAVVEFSNLETTKVSVKSQDKIMAKYSIEYLKRMINSSKLADRVKISFSKDYPVKLDFVAEDRVSMSFVLAPRVDDS